MRSHLASPIAALFPGQGPQSLEMLERIEKMPDFADLYPVVCDVVRRDLLEEVREKGDAFLCANEIASTLTVLCSLLEFKRLQAEGHDFACFAGYSVGQWAAMAAAGMLTPDAAFEVVWRRAQFMNAVQASLEGGMLVVIGLKTDVVDEICRSVSRGDQPVAISNHNCVGQLSLAGSRPALERARVALERENPHKLVDVNVRGAWHCTLLSPAWEPFREFLDGVQLATPSGPVMDNVSGSQLPVDRSALLDALADHLVAPVQWHRCVKTMRAALGAATFVEVGHGDVLTKFGMFIDRRGRHIPSKMLN